MSTPPRTIKYDDRSNGVYAYGNHNDFSFRDVGRPSHSGPALMFGTLFSLIAMVSGVQIVIKTIIIMVFIFVVAFLWDMVNSFNLDIS